MTLLKQAKLYLIYVSLSPWFMAFLNEHVLPEGESYFFAKTISLITWILSVFFGGGYLFIENGDKIMKEIEGAK